MTKARILHVLIMTQWFFSGISALSYKADDTNDFEKHLLKGIVNIGIAYLKNYSPLAIVTADTWCNKTLHSKLGEAVLRELQDTGNLPVVVLGNDRTARPTRKSTTKPGSVILLLNDGDSGNEDLVLHSMLQTLSTSPSWNPRARFIIVSTAIPSSTLGQLKIVRSALNHSFLINILDAIFMTPAPGFSETSSGPPAIEILTCFPYGSNRNCSDNVDVTLLDRWEEEEVEEGIRDARFRNNVNLFPSKSITNLRGCKVAMAYLQWAPMVMSSDGNTSTEFFDEGLEVRIMKTVAEKTNFTLELRIAENNIKVHGYFAAQWLKPELLGAQDATRPHFTGAFTWFVPGERKIPRWKSLIRIFNPTFWLLVLLLYVLGSVTFWALARIPTNGEDAAAFSDVILIFMHTLSMILSESVYKKPKHTKCQMYFLLWAFYCLQINIAYQSSLIGFLANPGKEPRINNLDDLLESGIELGIQSGLETFFNDTSDPRNKRILKSYIRCDSKNIDVCLKRMAYKRNLAVAGGRIGIEFSAYTKYLKNGKPLYVPFKDNIQQGHMVMYLTKNSVLRQRIDSIVLRLQHSGLVEKWVHDLRRKFGKHFNKAPRKNGFCVLSLEHLEGAFYLLFLGLLTGLMTCFLEIIYNIWVTHLKNRLTTRN
ncbi:hypothetical protein L798_05493 [Zootermopsis nevadensis]|uniref:Ionotropic glutamate receptor C-terminal domain-containing protein n=1 Tax=Zootermopsis nevadensis TaxID=136037 RepID=A0A067RJA2_ZOONE|nr:hypothetical protein L798_05493 [Zootermopsis nevadensis]